MIYNKNGYKVKFYQDDKGDIPIINYLEKINKKEKAKILKYIEFLKDNAGYLDEPYSKHIKGKIRELRVDFSKNKHRIFYFTFIKKTIILLHAFLKTTAKTPNREINKAEDNLKGVINNPKRYE
ncbi:MAG: Phage-related protein [Candidatus Falkowbacteria bacterium GW2011_GWA2_39_24]|uniref:Phage-related protein n=1 Tax=Candidatus Falkowbacteria bacterium GW2011_GWA2_39_24 TaxID=1618634 RepID=A0A0G0NHB2_9BACT|nr:MAG: Phage-related protein [Candidatus Falkowbacteria bacterium GW2011_GWA2_39_24]